MSATVLQLPGTAPAAGLNLSRAEVEEASGGYVRPADQLRALQALGFTRAFRRNGGGPVILERGHYEAVRAGTYGMAEQVAAVPAWEPPPRIPWEETPLGRAQQRERENRARVAEENAAFFASLPKPTRRERKELERRRAEAEREAHAALIRFHAGKRRAAKLRRTVAWADMDAIRAIYAEARRLTKETGVEHHVDHEIPLQGKNVSGLHVHNNLRVITGSENSRKKNRFEVEP